MKKLLKSRIFIFIISGIVFTSLGVYAANKYNANEIIYNASNGINVTVNEALNNLYNIKQELDNIKNIGDATSSDIVEGKTAVVKGKAITGESSPDGTQLQKVKKIGTISFSTNDYRTATVDVSKLDENYSKYTVNNFLITLPNVISATAYASSSGYPSQSCNLNYSYNSSTGILTINWGSNSTYTKCGLSAILYVAS